MLGYAHPEVLVDTQWVAKHLIAPKVRVVEVGYDLSDYNSGHIPGAVGWGWSWLWHILYPPDQSLFR